MYEDGMPGVLDWMMFLLPSMNHSRAQVVVSFLGWIFLV
jgi:hypothetical protein